MGSDLAAAMDMIFYLSGLQARSERSSSLARHDRTLSLGGADEPSRECR